jgi:hypothetical protein
LDLRVSTNIVASLQLAAKNRSVMPTRSATPALGGA